MSEPLPGSASMFFLFLGVFFWHIFFISNTLQVLKYNHFSNFTGDASVRAEEVEV